MLLYSPGSFFFFGYKLSWKLRDLCVSQHDGHSQVPTIGLFKMVEAIKKVGIYLSKGQDCG